MPEGVDGTALIENVAGSVAVVSFAVITNSYPLFVPEPNSPSIRFEVPSSPVAAAKFPEP